MSNPYVVIGNVIPGPSDPIVERETYVRIVFDEQDFFTYGAAESTTAFDPSDKGERFYIFTQLGKELVAKPTFISTESWKNTKESASGFVTAVKSVMPKIIVPSNILVDNGLYWDDGTIVGSQYSVYPDGGITRDLFNWDILDSMGVPMRDDPESYHYAQVGAYWGSQYVAVKLKEDAEEDNQIQLRLLNPVDPPVSNEWDESKLVVDGAFCLMLNVTGINPAQVQPKDINDRPWSVTFYFGDVTMVISDAGSLAVKIGAGDETWTKATLAEGKAKEGPPQQQHINEKNPYVIYVYPVWNGIVVASGGQDTRGVVKSSSTFVTKTKAASIMIPPYSDGFDVTAPAPVLVDGSLEDVKVDFGDQLTVVGYNCRFEMAYLPCFFSRKMHFDEWFVASDDIPGVVSFEYTEYPIWTKNDTDYELGSVSVIESGTAGPIEDTSYYYVNWGLEVTSPNIFLRRAGELFGTIFEVREIREFDVLNGNGNFVLNYTPISPADSDATSDWTDYVQNVSVTLGLDGSSGTIQVDKYGIAGQEGSTFQSVGAVTINADGGYGTVAGNIFQGLGMGIGTAATPDGATWTIPLVGLEKKLDDIALINVPFFDGRTFGEAATFLTKYAGLIADFSRADPGDLLQASSDVNVARYDWKSGTTVRTALDDICESVLHTYAIWGGVIHFYKNGVNGIPLWLGPDRSIGYSYTKMMTVDLTPDFEDLRNEIVVMGLQAVPEGQGAELANIPTFPRVEARRNATTPNIPWAKSIFRALPGQLTIDEVEDAADRLASLVSKYIVIGRVSIPGNANCVPYDQWGSYVIHSVTHSLDLQSKTWTTDLDFTLPSG